VITSGDIVLGENKGSRDEAEKERAIVAAAEGSGVHRCLWNFTTGNRYGDLIIMLVLTFYFTRARLVLS